MRLLSLMTWSVLFFKIFKFVSFKPKRLFQTESNLSLTFGVQISMAYFHFLATLVLTKIVNSAHVHCSGVQKWNFYHSNWKTETTFSRQHSPKWQTGHLFCAFTNFGWVLSNKQILKNCLFWTVLSCFSLSTDRKIGWRCAGSI